MSRFAVTITACQGPACGLCWLQGPKFFALANDTGRATVQHQPAATEEPEVRRIAAQCPTHAIIEINDSLTTGVITKNSGTTFQP